MDWLVLLTPLLLVPVALLPPFLGCGIDASSSEETVEPEKAKPDTNASLEYSFDSTVGKLVSKINVTMRCTLSEGGTSPEKGGTEVPIDHDGVIEVGGLPAAPTVDGISCDCTIETPAKKFPAFVEIAITEKKYPTFLLKGQLGPKNAPEFTLNVKD